MQNRMKEIRKQKRMTQLDIVLKTGLSQKDVCRIENGQQMPGIENALKIASALGVAVEDIWKLEEVAK